MTTLRTQDSYQKKLYEFMQVVDVVCPACGGHAVVRNPALAPQKNEESLIRVVCETRCLGSCLTNHSQKCSLGNKGIKKIFVRETRRRQNTLLFCIVKEY